LVFDTTLVYLITFTIIFNNLVGLIQEMYLRFCLIWQDHGGITLRLVLPEPRILLVNAGMVKCIFPELISISLCDI
jgi:hypothetical protein